MQFYQLPSQRVLLYPQQAMDAGINQPLFHQYFSQASPSVQNNNNSFNSCQLVQSSIFDNLLNKIPVKNSFEDQIKEATQGNKKKKRLVFKDRNFLAEQQCLLSSTQQQDNIGSTKEKHIENSTMKEINYQSFSTQSSPLDYLNPKILQKNKDANIEENLFQEDNNQYQCQEIKASIIQELLKIQSLQSMEELEEHFFGLKIYLSHKKMNTYSCCFNYLASKASYSIIKKALNKQKKTKQSRNKNSKKRNHPIYQEYEEKEDNNEEQEEQDEQKIFNPYILRLKDIPQDIGDWNTYEIQNIQVNEEHKVESKESIFLNKFEIEFPQLQNQNRESKTRSNSSNSIALSTELTQRKKYSPPISSELNKEDFQANFSSEDEFENSQEISPTLPKFRQIQEILDHENKLTENKNLLNQSTHSIQIKEKSIQFTNQKLELNTKINSIQQQNKFSDEQKTLPSNAKEGSLLLPWNKLKQEGNEISKKRQCQQDNINFELIPNLSCNNEKIISSSLLIQQIENQEANEALYEKQFPTLSKNPSLNESNEQKIAKPQSAIIENSQPEPILWDDQISVLELDINEDYQKFLDRESKQRQESINAYIQVKELKQNFQRMQMRAIEGVRDLKVGCKLIGKQIFIYEKLTAPFLRGSNLFQCEIIKFIADWCYHDSQFENKFSYQIIVDISIQDQFKGFFNQILLRPDGQFREGNLQLVSKFSKRSNLISLDPPLENYQLKSKENCKAMEFTIINLKLIDPKIFFQEINSCNTYLKDKIFDFEQIDIEYLQKKCQESLNYEFKLLFEKQKMIKQIVGALNSLADKTYFIFGISDIDKQRDQYIQECHPLNNSFNKKNINNTLENYMIQTIEIIKEYLAFPDTKEIKVWKKQNQISVQIDDETLSIDFQTLKISDRLYPIKIIIPSSSHLIMLKSNRYKDRDCFHNYTYVRQNASVNLIYGYENVTQFYGQPSVKEINDFYEFKKEFLAKLKK